MDRLFPRPGQLVAVANLTIGSLLAVGAPARTSSPSFAAPKAVMPIEAWAVMFIIGGILCWRSSCFTKARDGALCLLFGAFIHSFWAFQLLLSATMNDSAALTGIGAYGWISLCHMVAAARVARQDG